MNTACWSCPRLRGGPRSARRSCSKPSHCDPTINLYDVYHGVRGGMEEGVLEAVIPVAARGCVW